MSEALWTVGVVLFLIGCVYLIGIVGAYRSRDKGNDD